MVEVEKNEMPSSFP